MNLTICISIFQAIDWIMYIYASVLVLYLLFFVWASRWQKKREYPHSKNLHSFIIFFPAYKEDAVIENVISNFLRQEYLKELYDIVVISDQMQPETLTLLKKYPISINEVQFENSTKAKALRFALSKLSKKYDIAIILDADNLVDPCFLQKINDAYTAGQVAMQTHRIAKSIETNMAILDAVSEEINNTIFRQGHIRAGLSSALIGSGMAFDFSLFKECITTVDENHVGEDKQLELLLLRKRIFIEYLEDVYTFDEKISKTNNFYQQRRRWLSTQFSSLSISIRDFYNAVRDKNWSYCDKIFQWSMPSRVILLGMVSLLTGSISLYDWHAGIKWICLLGLLIGTLVSSIPSYLKTSKLCKALVIIPLLFLFMLINHFRLFRAGKKFIHTDHGNNT